MNQGTDNIQRPHITHVGVVGVSVSDQDVALRFYVGALGFEKRGDYAQVDGERWIEVAPRGAATTMALVRSSGDGTGVETAIRLCVATTHSQAVEDMSRVHADLLARGVDVDPEVTQVPGIPPMFSMRDPDGNVLRVIASEHRALT